VPGVPFGGVDPLWIVGSDGLLRSLRVTDGGQIDPPVPFLPPDARASSVVYVDGLVYTSTSNGCGNAPNAVWGIDLLSPEKTVAKWETGGANVAGGAGVTLGTSGIVYAATGAQPPDTRAWLTGGPAPSRYANSVVALDRVICCYPDMTALVGRSASLARRRYGLVYPRDTWLARAAVALLNARFRLSRSTFRSFVHPTSEVEAVIARHGLVKRSQRTTLIWQLAIYERPAA
jgi:hypothetical protein